MANTFTLTMFHTPFNLYHLDLNPHLQSRYTVLNITMFKHDMGGPSGLRYKCVRPPCIKS